jgi:calcium-dependent protein kinase
MWSAGCVLFVMLTGELPFTGANSEAIRTEVTKGEIAMTSPVWSQISDEAKDLIRKMIEVNPDFRIRASEALDHPWISSNIHLTQDTGRALGILTLKKFQGEKKLKQALASFIADRFSSEQDAEELRQIFQTMDIDHSGKLSRGELIDGLSRQMSPEEAVDLVDSILKEADTDHSQTLDYSEFVAASSLQKQMLSRKMVETAFQVLDKDKSGTLNVRELMALLGEAVQGGEAALKLLIAQADTNKDGELSLKEFTELLLHPQPETS